MDDEEFERLVVEAFKRVHAELGEALSCLAARDILDQTYFNDREGIFLVWLKKPESVKEGGDEEWLKH